MWINHNQHNFSRIYPKGTRVDSSNYNPCPGFAVGAHMVALNYQVHLSCTRRAHAVHMPCTCSCTRRAH
jgi:hypothetical protein